MLVDTAVAFFGSKPAIARALSGKRSTSAVYQWGRVVPLGAAKRLAAISDGAIGIDETLYDENGRAFQDPNRKDVHAA